MRDHPDLVGPIRWLVRRGDLHVVLPGVYAPRLEVDTFGTRIRALRAWDPNAVLVAAAAARVSFWPTIRVPIVTCALEHHRRPQRGFHFSRRRVPAELVMSRAGLRYTSPALTALDLCESHGGDAIDEALRAPATTLKDLHGRSNCQAPASETPNGADCCWTRRMSPGRLQSGGSTGFFEPQELPPGRRTSPSCSVARCSTSMSSSPSSPSSSTAGSTTAARKYSRPIVGERIS
jgi:hypothetical protein